jgi:hypothetical protein
VKQYLCGFLRCHNGQVFCIAPAPVRQDDTWHLLLAGVRVKAGC